MNDIDKALNHIKETNRNVRPDISLSLLNKTLGLELKEQDFDKVAKDNSYLSKKYQPLVNLYGFDTFLDLFTYSISQPNGEIHKSLNRYNKPIEVALGVPSKVSKGNIKSPLPGDSDAPSDKDKQPKDDEPLLTFNTLGETFGKVSPESAGIISSIPKSFTINGTLSNSCDDYLFHNLNGITQAVAGLKVGKRIELEFVAYREAPSFNKHTLYTSIVYALTNIGLQQQKDVKIDKKLVEDSPALEIMSSNQPDLIKYKDLEVEEQ